MIKSILKDYPRLNFSVLPVPIYKLEKLSKHLSVNLYCMRDDLTGFAFGGNKSRKLDFLIADALKNKCDTLIGIGANQSNFCRITAAAGKVAKMDVHLVLTGNKPEKPTGNLLVDHLFGANIHYINSDDEGVINQYADELATKLTTNGKKVYKMPPGGSTPIGILGYVRAFSHIINFSRQKKIFFDSIIHASGTGGTQTGLVIGKNIVTGWVKNIRGICVSRNKESMCERVKNMCHETAKILDIQYNTEDIQLDDNYLGEGYGIKTKDAQDAIELFAQTEGILLDNVYTGKAAAALIDYARNKNYRNNKNILFIHTGGNIELFA